MADDSTTTPVLKIIAGADPFGESLKTSLVSHLRSLNIEVEDLGTSAYYSIAAEVGRRVAAAASSSTRGLVSCGTGAGVAIFANKFPGVYAATCLSKDDAINARSINDCNVISVSGIATSAESGIEIVDAWLSTPFKAPCPASGLKPWSDDVLSFLDNAITEMPKIGTENIANDENNPAGVETGLKSEKNKDDDVANCALCCLAKNRKLEPITIIPGGSMKIVRESDTSAFVSFKSGSIEPAHHHTFGHDLVVLKGSKRVWNLSRKAKYDLGVGDYLFTPAGDVHRVKYFEDTEFFIKWEGKWDMFFDEELEEAEKAIAKESEDGFEWLR